MGASRGRLCDSTAFLSIDAPLEPTLYIPNEFRYTKTQMYRDHYLDVIGHVTI